MPKLGVPLGYLLCIRTSSTDQLNPMFHTFAEYRPMVNRIVSPQSTDWLPTSGQFSANVAPYVFFYF